MKASIGGERPIGADEVDRGCEQRSRGLLLAAADQVLLEVVGGLEFAPIARHHLPGVELLSGKVAPVLGSAALFKVDDVKLLELFRPFLRGIMDGEAAAKGR